MKISLGGPPGPGILELARRAEALGYDRIWLFDSAAIYEDVWIHLARIAEATRRIGLGTAVLVPSLRHVMTTASAIATVERLAPGRLACALGTGYTARLVLGQKPLAWKLLREYVEQLRGLLRGEVVEIEGRPCQMIHRPELARPRPIEVPLLLSAFGPKGLAITREIADGWMGGSPPPEPFAWAVQMALNLTWTVVFFGFRAPWPAAVVIVALVIAVAIDLQLSARVRPLAGALLMPYLVWCGFAAALNLGVAVLN